jgi:hypothetical protein
METFDAKQTLAGERARVRLERNKQIREATRALRNQKHPVLRRKFRPKKKRGNPHGYIIAINAAPQCMAINKHGGRCGKRAQRGSPFCHTHNNRSAFAYRIWLHGRQCTATCVATGERCKRRAAKGFPTCMVHGAKAELTRRAIVAAGDTPEAFAARKRKQAAHRARMAEYRNGERPRGRESWSRFMARQEREERQRSSLEGQFREQQTARPLRPLYPA